LITDIIFHHYAVYPNKLKRLGQNMVWFSCWKN